MNGLGPADLAVFAAFWGLIAGTLAQAEGRRRLRHKPGKDWVLDLTGLLVQGLVIPVAQVSLAAALVRQLDPGIVGSVDLPPVVLFLLSFVGVDYLFYWNHRLLHGPLWAAHKVHHTMTDRDVLGTSRNTLWTSFLICYLWVHGVALVVLADPTFYLAGVAATSALDLWRHSTFDPPPALARLLDPWLILPRDHAWHHEAAVLRGNYGANWKLWDRLHGTFIPSDAPPAILGHPVGMGLARQLFFPFGPEEEVSTS